jgi:hypothetical protein
LDLQKIVSDLAAERDRIARAIEALLESPSKRGRKKGVKRPRATGKASRRNNPRGQTALVTGNEEALGGTQEKEILAVPGARLQF